MQMSDALRAAAASAAAKSAAGSSATDSLRPDSHPQDVVFRGIELDTEYLGLQLRNPLVASAGPIQQSVGGLKSLADAGVGAVVLFSLFEEQIRYEEQTRVELVEGMSNSFAEAMTYFPTQAASSSGVTKQYLQLIEDGANVIDVPLIASINGSTVGSWAKTAKRMEDAGAAAIELNIYYIAGYVQTDARSVEDRHLEILNSVKSAVSIPVSVKLGPYFSAFGQFARKLDDAGADGLVLFNRFVQPDIDIELQEVVPGLELSTSFEARLPRTWIAALRRHIKASLALTTGVETTIDVVKAILAGADVVMTTSALLKHGPEYAQTMIDGLTGYLTRKRLSLKQARGLLAVPEEAPVDEYERSGYLSAIEKAKRIYGR